MKTSILLFSVLISFCASTQTVKPVISQDYLMMIKNDSASIESFLPDTFNSIRSTRITSPTFQYGTVRKMGVKNNQLTFKPAKTEALLISGSFNAFVEMKTVNRTPELQNQYVQGSSQNGKLEWHGAETDEMFSFGPAIESLEFDGSQYHYDLHGRFVEKGLGNGQTALAYNNDILKNAFLFSRSLSMQAKYRKGFADFITTSFKLGNSNEDPFLPYSRNKTGNGAFSIEAATKKGKLTGSYRSQSTDISKANRNGYLNRIYQNMLLTPVSFSNHQGTEIANDQRSYSQLGDNPLFLLKDNQSGYRENHDLIAIGFERRASRFQMKFNQSYELGQLHHTEILKQGTAFFELGQLIDRKQTNRNYSLQANAKYDLETLPLGHLFYHLKSFLSLNYLLTASQTEIGYFHSSQYNYRRNSHDISANFTGNFEGDKLEGGVRLENKMYVSNTSRETDLFLPALSANIVFTRLLDSKLRAKLVGTVNHYNSELPMNQSYATSSSVLYNNSEALKFAPIQEVQSFSHLSAIRNRDVSIRSELFYKYKLGLNAEFFQHWISKDVFPVMAFDKLHLLNIASHKNQGFELELTWYGKKKNLGWNTALSFTTYRSIVTDVREGFNHLPVSGFGNIHKTIIDKQPLGVIEGKAFLRDANHHVIIGDDGFPMVDPVSRIIGDPNPDFIMKLWNGLSWKKLTCNISWEWKKGGEAWNGTAATLDYYGRSKNSSDYRNVTGYVFDGVTQSGHINTKQVSFYDPALPVTYNRWTRNGFGGVDEEYIQKADWIRIDNFSLSYKLTSRKYLQGILLSAYTNNILVWTPYQGGDPAQLFYDQSNSTGLDFFNLPSMKQFGCSVTLQF